ncbi:MAG TPA: hypothetical protein VF520_00600 [Thermoleophilaceae bacterium]
MAHWPEFNPRAQLRRLVRREADFVVVGAFAAVLHGSSRLTADLDIAFAPDRANLEALATALVDLKARLRGVEEDVPFVPDADTLRRVSILTLDTDEGPLDLIREPPGAPSYAILRRRAEPYDVDGMEVPTASIEDLIEMKRAAGRTKDLADVEELEAIRALREGSHAPPPPPRRGR